MLDDNPELFWKNFRLGTELQVSGAFIYNALYTLENMQHFYYEDECFEFLYQISVGIERLLKIVVILLEHDGKRLQEDYEKDLITHSHMELAGRIKKKRKSIDFGKTQNKFLTLLTEFYKSARYDRYSLSSVYHPNQDKEQLVEYVSREMKMPIETGMMLPTPVSDEIRRFLGKVISRIVLPVFEVLMEETGRLHIYTYEVSSRSKAYKIFVAKEFDFYKERVMQREVALYLLNSMPEGSFKDFVNGTDAIPFGQLSAGDYFESMLNIHKSRDVKDEMEFIYKEEGLDPSRMEMMSNLGAHTWYDEDDDSFEGEE